VGSAFYGVSLFSRSQFLSVNGFSEVLRTEQYLYEDFYNRLRTTGFTEKSLPETMLYEIGPPKTNDYCIGKNSVYMNESALIQCHEYLHFRNILLSRELMWESINYHQRYTEVELSVEGRYKELVRLKEIDLKIPSALYFRLHTEALKLFVSQIR